MLENQALDRDNEIYLLSKIIAEDNLNYIYCGDFTQSIIVDILSLTEKNILHANETSKAKKKVYNLMVEALQNIPKHQAQISIEYSNEKGLFIIQHHKNKYYITTGNIIFNENIEEVINRISIVNELDPEGLKAYYKQQLVNGSISDRGGAGLGLIDMARKSENKLHYDFNQINDTISYFYFRISIDSQIVETTPTDVEENEISLQYVINVHELIRQKSILLIYNNNFLFESKNNFVLYLEKLLVDSLDFKKEFIDISSFIIERIADISAKSESYSEGKEILFYIFKENDCYRICSGCHIKNIFLTEFEQTLSLATSLYNRFKTNDNIIRAEISEETRILIKNINMIDTLSFEFIKENDIDFTYFALNTQLVQIKNKSELESETQIEEETQIKIEEVTDDNLA